MSLNLGELVAYIKADRDGFRSGVRHSREELAQFQRDANGRLRDLRGKFVSEGEAAGRGWAGGLRKGLGPLAPMLAAIGAGLAGLGPAAVSAGRMSLLVPIVLGLVSHMGSLVGAIAPAAGALIALPGIIAGAGIALTVWKLGAAQLGEVVKAETTPALEELRSIAGRGLSAGMGRDIQGLVKVWMPALRTGFRDISGDLNGILRQAVAFAASRSAVSDWAGVMGETHAATALLGPSLASVLAIVTDLVSVGSGMLPGLAGGLTDALGRAQAFIAAARADGRLWDWMQTGLDTLQGLGRILEQVGGILHAVFSQSQAAGGGLLGTIESVLTAVNQFLSSPTGQSGLALLFQTADQIISTGLLPTLLTLATGVANVVLPALMQIGTALAPVLPQIAQGLVGAVTALAPAIGPLATAIAAVLVAVTPLLPIVGQLAGIIAANLGTALSVLARVLGPVIAQMAGALAPVLPQLASAALQFGAAIAPVAAELGGKLGAALAKVLPKLTDIALAVIDQLLPHLPELVTVISQVAEIMGQLAEDSAADLLNTLTQIGPYIPGLVEASLQWSLVLLQLLPGLIAVSGWIGKLTSPLLYLGGVIEWVKGFFSNLGDDAGKAGDQLGNIADAIGNFFSGLAGKVGHFFTVTVPGWWDSLTGWLSALPGKIGDYLAELPGKLSDLARDALMRMAYAVGYGIGSVIAFFRDMPPKIWAEVTSLWDQAGTLVSTGIDNLVTFFSELPGKVGAWIDAWWTDTNTKVSSGIDAMVTWVSGLPDRIGAWLSKTFEDGKRLVSSGIDAVIKYFSDLPGKASSAASALPGKIKSALTGAIDEAKKIGGQILSGLADGISGAVGRAVQAAKDAVASVVKGAKDALGVRSPSRVFMGIGVNTMLGYAAGVTGAEPIATQAVTSALGRGLDAPIPGVGTSRGTALAPAPSNGAGSTGGGGGVHTIIVKGDGLLSALREIIEIRGGVVQTVLGSA